MRGSRPTEEPLEKRYGAALGTLAFASRSILPPIITHAFADSVVFTGAQSEVGPERLWTPPLLSESRFDPAVAGTVVVGMVPGTVAIIAMRRLRHATKD